MAMPIPEYLSLEHDPATRKITVAVQDAKERKQREMWGPYTNPLEKPARTEEAYSRRYDPRLPSKPRSRRL